MRSLRDVLVLQVQQSAARPYLLVEGRAEVKDKSNLDRALFPRTVIGGRQAGRVGVVRRNTVVELRIFQEEIIIASISEIYREADIRLSESTATSFGNGMPKDVNLIPLNPAICL